MGEGGAGEEFTTRAGNPKNKCSWGLGWGNGVNGGSWAWGSWATIGQYQVGLLNGKEMESLWVSLLFPNLGNGSPAGLAGPAHWPKEEGSMGLPAPPSTPLLNQPTEFTTKVIMGMGLLVGIGEMGKAGWAGWGFSTGPLLPLGVGLPGSCPGTRQPGM